MGTCPQAGAARISEGFLLHGPGHDPAWNPSWTSQVAPAPQIPMESGFCVLAATHPMLMESRGVTSVRSGYWYRIPLLPFGKMRQGELESAWLWYPLPLVPQSPLPCPPPLQGHIPAAGHPQTVALATKPVAWPL